MNDQELVSAVRRHAQEHYSEGGWDIVYECWEDGDILRARPTPTSSLEETIQAVGRIVGTVAGKRSEVVAAGGGCPECLAFMEHEEGCTLRGQLPLFFFRCPDCHEELMSLVGQAEEDAGWDGSP